MKLLLVGGGAREHALAWKLSRDLPALELLAAPGNPGISSLARCLNIAATDVAALRNLAEAEKVDATIVGPEAPLAAGIVDHFRQRGLPIFGPTTAAARIETSKRFSKELMLRAGVPTARATTHTSVASARRAVRELGAPLVIKASGLAAGKGVIVCDSEDDADAAIHSMLADGAFGEAGSEVLVEEFMEGEELSLFVLTDGEYALPMLPAQDHKRLLEGDHGPNTGGMGAIAPVSTGTASLVNRAMSEIIEPTLGAMRDEGSRFTGLLYAGLMLTSDGPKVVEFNCRFGDPETEAILPLMHGSLLDPMLVVAAGESLRGATPFAWYDAVAVTTVVAAGEYPERSSKGEPIALPAVPGDNVQIFHAGTARERDGSLVTAGGRILAVTAVGPTLDEARRESVRVAGSVHFSGRRFRRDIGWREAGRRAGAA